MQEGLGRQKHCTDGLVGFVVQAVFHLLEYGGVESPLGLIFYNP